MSGRHSAHPEPVEGGASRDTRASACPPRVGPAASEREESRMQRLIHLRRTLPLLGGLAAVLIALVVLPGIASAHETRVVDGKYKFVVGFLNEPAIVDQPNSIDLTVTDASTGQP